MKLSPEDQKKQELYRDARVTEKYDDIWQNVGKCVFCDLNDKYIIFEENNVVLTISLYAYIDGHCMVIPRRHVRSVKDLTQKEWEAVRKLMHLARQILKKEYKAKGIQFVQKDGLDAQSTVEHLHFHCIPFDQKDLNVWNVRKLANTPLENTAVYRQARKRLIETADRFDKKYYRPIALPVICDVLIFNTNDEILLEERVKSNQLSPNYWTPPGGVVDDFSKSFETEVVREVKEETGLSLKPTDVKLLYSQVGNIKRSRLSAPLKAKYNQQDQFVWNTFMVRDINPKVILKAGDDAAKLIWLPVAKALSHPNVSPGIRQLIKRANNEPA